MIKKAIKNITKLKTQSKGKGFKNLFPQDECKVKQIIAKQPAFRSLKRLELRESKKIKDIEYFDNWYL